MKVDYQVLFYIPHSKPKNIYILSKAIANTFQGKINTKGFIYFELPGKQTKAKIKCQNRGIDPTKRLVQWKGTSILKVQK